MSSRDTDHRLISDRYELRDVIGSGGMGTVWRAEDRLLQREVAVKEVRLPPALSGDEGRSARRRVEREAQAAARLTHPNSVTVFDIADDGEGLFIVMELVDSGSLADLVTRDGPLAPERVATIGADVLDALRAAHASGIVHRDVKPANVMVPADGRVKLTDFGIASVADDPSITATGLVLGSPAYMPPEQARGDGSGPEADLWALGATMYYAVEGVPPFDRGATIATMTSVVNDPPRDPQRAGALWPVIEGLLAKDPAERPSGERLAGMLRDVASGTAGGASAAGATTAVAGAATQPLTRQANEAVPSAPATAGAPPPRPDGRRDAAASSANRGLILAGVASIVLVLLLGGLALLTTGDDGDGVDTAADAPADTTPAEDANGTEAPTPDETEAPAEQPTATEAPDPAPAATTGWQTFTDSATGYRIEHPEGWEVARLDGSRTDFRDPDSGAYLRVDWIQPPGDDPVAAWEAQSASFAERYPDYREVRIDPTTYQGFDAAEWEYTYEGQRALNLGFVTDDYGFALNFQSPESNWSATQETRDRFRQSFRPPG